MPHGIEYIVRPFASPGSLGNIVIPAATPQATPEVAHIVWGGHGTMPAVKLLNPSTVVNTKKETLTEQSRDTDRIRIIGNDGESYVDVDRPRQMRLDGLTDETSSGTLSSTYYHAGAYLDDDLDPYVRNFSGLSANPKYKVEWILKNEEE